MLDTPEKYRIWRVKLRKQNKNSRTCPRCKGKGTIGKSQYHKGRRFEYKVRDFLQDRGWEVHRSYGSKGVIDLLAIKGDIKLGIQVKNRKTGLYLTPKEQYELVQFWSTFEDNERYSYTINQWKSHKIVPLTVKGPINTVLAASVPMVSQIQWRCWDGARWFDCSKLIKTGKL